ncbi:hypothetical protein ACFFGV_12755 [Pontibacillus salicampi]|uniref:KTSC domain-containing protein n=1 Tax=Pontibacillus salicampi TaxID=1449801 RepID=A0ABV6LPW7_9BACI
MYRVIGYSNQVRVSFADNRKEMLFTSFTDAEQFVEKIRRDETFPQNYSLKIEEVQSA